MLPVLVVSAAAQVWLAARGDGARLAVVGLMAAQVLYTLLASMRLWREPRALKGAVALSMGLLAAALSAVLYDAAARSPV